MILSKNYLEKLQPSQMYDLAKFVVVENFNHHSDGIFPKNYEDDVEAVYKEELKYYHDSEVYVSKDSFNSIFGSIRVLKWNFVDILPLQKIFGINPLLAISQPNINAIYHIGRFAIKKDVKGINLFKQLMVCAITPICQHKDNIAFAECDCKLLKVLNLLGIETNIIGDSINYLGSETIPIAMTYDGLIEFYNKNKSLLNGKIKDSVNPSVLPESVVLSPLADTTL